MATNLCPLCREPLEEGHDLALCEKTELIKGRTTINQLKSQVQDWKNAYHELREIIGKLWWYHPAISNDEARAYYQNIQCDFERSKVIVKHGFVYDADKIDGLGKPNDWHYRSWNSKA